MEHNGYTSNEEVVAHIAVTNLKLDSIDTSLKTMTSKINIQNGRIQKLENLRSYFLGVGGAVGGIIGLISLAISVFRIH